MVLFVKCLIFKRYILLMFLKSISFLKYTAFYSVAVICKKALLVKSISIFKYLNVD